ncbi:MAG: nickel-dependent lactate racemase [Clostridiales bacterium]|nr:nickel-dependent lactate racemase [Clostridiales bacterium]
MEHRIRYGHQELSFQIPQGCRFAAIHPKPVSAAPDAQAEIRRALDQEIGASLASLASPGKRVCIICDDISRPTPVSTIVPLLLHRLTTLGVQKEAIYFVLALGSHRRMTHQEVEHKLGAEIAGDFAVYQSSFADPSELLDLGHTEDGAVIEVYRRVMDSDVRIGIGNIVPHNTLGWSGGSKILFPGVTSEETVSKFHMRAMMPRDERIFGNVNNSVRRDVETWTEKIGLHYIINTVLTGEQALYRAVAGHHVLAHRQGVEYARDVFSVPAPYAADIVLVDSYPSDCDFWQGTKGFNAADVVVRDGGSAILVSPFYEGVGPHPEYPVMVGRDDASSLLDALIARGPSAAPGMDPLAVAVGALISRMRQRFDMYVYSDGVEDALLESARIRRTRDLGQTLAELNERYGGHADVLLIHSGAEVVPELPIHNRL